MTIGIGAGNPGGGTFDAVVFLATRVTRSPSPLTDEPFERVRRGAGADAEQARAHGDLQFVWWVADIVTARDCRAWWMLHWLEHARHPDSGGVRVRGAR